jgi:GrpB-like predicted nucleotidyltransferase (UPF0157 family)
MPADAPARDVTAHDAPQPRTLPADLARRLATAGVSDISDPVLAWRKLREAEGPRASGIDLYRLAARQRGIAVHELPGADRAALASAATPVLIPGYRPVAHRRRAREPVDLVPYSPDWPRRFDWWRGRIRAALGATALRAEHVGSTSVPGLAAKPVIDIQVSVADIADEARYAGQLESLGLQLGNRDDVHRYFSPVPEQPRELHLHLCQAGSGWERDHLLFRDYLRAHPAAADRYLAGKRAAAIAWRDDRWAYTEAKTDVILDILEDAEAWSRATGWTLPPASAQGEEIAGAAAEVDPD